ncbi:hypothetical protein ANCCEY_10757 [Ancylostoma ceylanicum]|uniref:Leishmanolysin-like peptidase n=1 Tax=Ancylostoma ceylanicum TaxID=53326 RepID=A0A0D6LG28_9BILA|nr:hypothetical protein ANCCEY_10757 [Ancylostoma ceylanicum]
MRLQRGFVRNGTRSLGRPIAGFVNVCPEAFNRMKASEISQWEATIKHELIHAFVFSTSLFPKFPLAKGNPKKIGPMVVVPGVIEQFTRLDWETAEGITPHTVFMMVTPKVREEARNFFKCPDLEGAEIENQGGNEAMSGVATQVYALSRLTLALFEDSGWYIVNYAFSHQRLVVFNSMVASRLHTNMERTPGCTASDATREFMALAQ